MGSYTPVVPQTPPAPPAARIVMHSGEPLTVHVDAGTGTTSSDHCRQHAQPLLRSHQLLLLQQW